MDEHPVMLKVHAPYIDFNGTGFEYLETNNTHKGGGEGRGFANGGRATEASIFGEAGAEWAIPEEHTKRTADLLQAAAAASGFSWADLLGMYGGLNSGSGRSAPVVYSPTIYAQDATGVEQKLKEDKERFERWWQERKLRDSMEVYA